MDEKQFPSSFYTITITMLRLMRFSFTLVLCCFAILPSILWTSFAEGSKPVLRLAVNPWVGSELNAHIAKIILEEELGYETELVSIDENAQFPALADGLLDATLEVWPSGHGDDYREYVEGENSVEDLGPLGVIGKIGWYVPGYLVESDPSLATWEGIKENADLFRTAASGEAGQFLTGEPTWSSHDQEIITTLGLNLKIVYSGSENDLLAAIDAAFAEEKPLLFYFWSPHAFSTKHELSEVALPPDARYGTDVTYKAVAARLSDAAPAAYGLLKRFSLSNSDQIAMMAEMTRSGVGTAEAAAAWVAQNEPTWRTWLGRGREGFPPIPAPANAWAEEHLFVIDKDTDGVYVGVNDLYAQSRAPLFPQIETRDDFIGRDVFCFFPFDQAKRFQADDRRVIESGIPVSEHRVIQPMGGAPQRVNFTKVPLRDATGAIIGLRAVWHSATRPSLEIRNGSGGVEVSYPDDASTSIYHLESNDELSDPAGWSPEIGPPVFADGNLIIRSQPGTDEDGQKYFRLNSNRTVKIGALISLTGEWSTLGRNIEAALDVGVEALNLEELSSGSGVRFHAEVRDTKLDPDLALSQLQELASDGVRLVIGPQSSAEVALLKPFADANDIVLISPGSTASSLSIADDNVLRFCPDDTHEARAMVAMLQADGIEAIVPVWRDDVGNQGLRDSMVQLFPMEGGTVSAGFRYAADESDFQSVAKELAAQIAEAQLSHRGRVAVYLAGFDEVARLFVVAKSDPGLDAVPWYGSDGVVQSSSLAADEEAALFAVEHGYPCPIFGLDARFATIWKPLSTGIQRRSGVEADAFALAAYDGLRVAALAYRAVGVDGAFSELRTAFIEAAGTYTGATGATVLNAAGDRDGGAFDFWSLKMEERGYTWYQSASFEPDDAQGGSITRLP